MKTLTRGVVPILLLVYIVGGLGAGAFCVHEYKTLFASGRNKKGADTAAAAAQSTQTQAVVVKDSAADVAYAVAKSTAEHAVVIATRDAIDQNAAGFIEGAKDAVQSDPTPTQAEIIALVMLDSASDSLGQPLTLKQKKAWMETVGGLIAKNADTEAKLAKQTSDAIALRASLDATQAHAKAADDTSVALTAQLSAKATELVNEAKKSSDLAAKNKEWARSVVVNGNVRISNQSNMVSATNYLGSITTAYRMMMLAENATAFAPTLSTDANLTGFQSTPRIDATSATSFITSNLGVLIAPQFIASAATSRISSTGIYFSLIRNNVNDLSSYSVNSMVVMNGLMGHYLGPASTIVTQNVVGINIPCYNYNGTITTATTYYSRFSVGTASGSANPVIGTCYGLRLDVPAFANGGTITNEWGISQESTTEKNQFLGSHMGIGQAPTTTSLLNIKKSGLPTSSAGLASGDVWNSGGVLNIV